MILSEYIKADTLIFLGTSGSMWSSLIEYYARNNEYEDLRLQLFQHEELKNVPQEMLDSVASILESSLSLQLGKPVRVFLKLISAAADQNTQIGILESISGYMKETKTSQALHIDITHGFRHMRVTGFLSASLLERLSPDLTIQGIWYGAMDMTTDGLTPVINLNGLQQVQRWIKAMDQFEASGNYAVFADLLMEDNLPKENADQLRNAAFFESINNISAAAAQLRYFFKGLNAINSGASMLFRDRLSQHLSWAKELNIYKMQKTLALLALHRKDYMRAVLLGHESLISKLTLKNQKDPLNYSDREASVQEFERELQNDTGPTWLKSSFHFLRSMRNSLAHTTPSSHKEVNACMKDKKRLDEKLRKLLKDIEHAGH